MNHTALVLCLRKHLSHSFQHTQTLVSNNEFDALKATAPEPLEEADPAGLIFFHSLGCAQNLTVAILIDGDCH